MLNEQLSEGACILPGGLVLNDGRCLSRAELRPLTGREEEWLARHTDTPCALIVTNLLCACLVRLDELAPEPELIRRLLVGDRDYLILPLRRLTLGEVFAAVLPCPACHGRMDVSFPAREIPVTRRPQSVAVYQWQPAERAENRAPLRFR